MNHFFKIICLLYFVTIDSVLMNMTICTNYILKCGWGGYPQPIKQSLPNYCFKLIQNTSRRLESNQCLSLRTQEDLKELAEPTIDPLI